MSLALLTLALVGTLGLAATMLAGYFPAGPQWIRQHFVAALASTFLLVMGHSFIMFFLIATGVAMKDIEKQRGWGEGFRRRLIAMKSRAFPLMTLTLLLVIANFVVGAAAHTRQVPGWVHAGLAWGTLLACVVTLHREYRVLGENNRLIAEAGRRGGPVAPREDTLPSSRA